MSAEVVILFDHIPATKHKLEVGARLVIKNMLKSIASNAQQAAPPGRIRVTATETEIKVTPWYAGFVELGTVQHGARPFLEPASNRGFREFTPKMKILGDSL